jgi:osmoprotectant transport system substrate-binding protein
MVAAACGSAPTESAVVSDDELVIGSFDFPESQLLAEVYAQSLELAGIPVRRLGVIGSREIVEPALESGSVDLVPEYAGTLLSFLTDDAASSDLDVVLDELEPLLDERGLVALRAAEARDSNAFVVTQQLADDLGLSAVTDLTGVASELRFGGPVECRQRTQCLLGLQELYGLEFAEFVPLANLDITAEALRRQEVEIALMFTTAPQLANGDLVVLFDNLGLQPADNVVPIVRGESLARWGEGLVAAVDRVSSVLTTDDLIEGNRAMSQGLSAADAAADWLARIGS